MGNTHPRAILKNHPKVFPFDVPSVGRFRIRDDITVSSCHCYDYD
jgi:hypothetical protein